MKVSAFFYHYRRDLLGMDEAKARADMEAVGRAEGLLGRTQLQPRCVA